MSREIKLHRVDIWNRATIADGKKLQATTIRPLSANDVILAEAISGYKKELQDYYDNEYTKLTTVIAPDITKWNGTTMNVYMNLDKWNRTYDAVQNSGHKWNSAYNVLGASANIWNSTVGSACSGAAASGWLSVNELPNSDHITDFDALRPAAETDDHYKRYGETTMFERVWDEESRDYISVPMYTTRIVGPSTLSLTTHSAWKYDTSTTPPTPIINIGDNFCHVSGSNNFCVLPGCVQSVDGTHSMVTHCRNYQVSGLFNSTYIGMLGNLAKTQSIQAIPSTDYSHIDTENSLLFIKGGCEDFKNSLSLAALSTIGITNSFTRGGMTQNVKNSLSVGYCTKEGGNIYNGDELYSIFDSLTNFKGRTLGTHNSLTIKGTVSGTKGSNSSTHYAKNTYDVGFYNSHTNYFGGSNGYQHASALWNSVEHIYDCGSSPSAEMVNTYYFNKNGYIDQDSNEAYFNNSFITLNSGNILKQPIENSLVKIKNITLDTRYVKQCYLDTSACGIVRGSTTYDDSYIKSNNAWLGVGNYVKQSLLYNYSAMSLVNDVSNSDRSLIYNMYNTYIGPSYFQNSFIFRLSGGNGGGAGHFTNYGHNRCVNNFIDLVVPEAFNSEVLAYNTLGAEMLENSYIRTNFKARYGYAVTNFKYKNSFVNYDGVYTDGVFPGGDYQNNSPFFLLCTNTSAHSRLSSPSTFSIPNLFVLKNSKLTQGGLFTIGEKINLQYPYYGRKATKFIMGSNFTNTVNKGHNSLDDFFIFGNNNHYIDERDYPGYVHFGNNMNLSDNAIYKKLTSKLKTLQLQNSLFVVSNDEGPFFMVFGNIDSDIDGNVFYYKKSEDAWYNVKTKTKL